MNEVQYMGTVGNSYMFTRGGRVHYVARRIFTNPEWRALLRMVVQSWA